MSRTYRRTQKGRKATWLPEIHSYNLEEYHRSWMRCVYHENKDWEIFDPYRREFLYDEDAKWLNQNPHRRNDINDSLYHYKCKCDWCLGCDKYRALKVIADAEMKAAREGRDTAYETVKPKSTKKYHKPFEVWKRTVYSGPTKDRSYRWGQTWYRIGRYRTREVAEQAMSREMRIWKAFEKEDYWYQFEIREIK